MVTNDLIVVFKFWQHNGHKCGSIIIKNESIMVTNEKKVSAQMQPHLYL
jgi:hypothetical protein